MFKFCPKCGNKLNGSFKFCSNCGFKLENTNSNEKEDKKVNEDIFDDDLFASLEDTFTNKLDQINTQNKELKKALDDLQYYTLVDDKKNATEAFEILQNHPNSFEFFYGKLIVESNGFTKFDSNEISSLITTLKNDFKDKLNDKKFEQYIQAYNNYLNEKKKEKEEIERRLNTPLTEKEKEKVITILKNVFGITTCMSNLVFGFFPDSQANVKEELTRSPLYPRYLTNNKKELFYKDSYGVYFLCKPIQWNIITFNRKRIVLISDKILYASSFTNEAEFRLFDNKYFSSNFNFIDVISSEDTFEDIAFNLNENRMLSNKVNYKNDLESTTFKENDFVDDKIYTSESRIPSIKELKEIENKNILHKTMTPYAIYLWNLKNKTSSKKLAISLENYKEYWTRTPANYSIDKAYIFNDEKFKEVHVREIHGIVPIVEIDLLKLKIDI